MVYFFQHFVFFLITICFWLSLFIPPAIANVIFMKYGKKHAKKLLKSQYFLIWLLIPLLSLSLSLYLYDSFAAIVYKTNIFNPYLASLVPPIIATLIILGLGKQFYKIKSEDNKKISRKVFIYSLICNIPIIAIVLFALNEMKNFSW